MAAEAVSLILPVLNHSADMSRVVRSWHSTLANLSRQFELILVDQRSTDNSLEVAQSLATELNFVKLTSSAPGFGIALQAGLTLAQHPLIAYSSLDYPYTPSDIERLLKRIADVDPHLNRSIDLVSGCRNGQHSPVFWYLVGRGYRGLSRILFGLPLQAPLGWLGFTEHFRSWVAWFCFGDPLTDPNSAFKVIRRSVLNKFPIQSDGDFVHVEIVGKATFTTCLMDELPLTPQTARIPHVKWTDFGKVFRDAKFHSQSQPESSFAAASQDSITALPSL
jgi:glycosyltransferase involved in cell wall biosynthesis